MMHGQENIKLKTLFRSGGGVGQLIAGIGCLEPNPGEKRAMALITLTLQVSSVQYRL